MSSLADFAKKTLHSLSVHQNVIITGPPATGKTVLLTELARLFEGDPAGPEHRPGAPVPIPKNAAAAESPWLPSPAASNRAVFRTVFHQNSKYRDFVSGLMPSLQAAGEFEVSEGVLLRANDHASSQDGAALLIIDEMNRGPAVQLFGGAIVAVESDKRGDATGLPSASSVPFEALRSDGVKEVTLSSDLYIVGVMNQADTSVEALDVAFLRRWEAMRLDPSWEVLAEHLGVTMAAAELPASPTTSEEVYRAAIRAWSAVNKRIAAGRGGEYRLGHGVFMTEGPAATVAEAEEHVSRAWTKVLVHIEEVFFGDQQGVAVVLNLFAGPNPVAEFKTELFGDEPRERVESPNPIPANKIYGYLLAVAKDGDS